MQRMTWTWTEEEEEEEVDNFEGAAGKAIVPSRGGGREGELVTTVSLFLSRIRTGGEEKWCNKGGSKNKIRLLHFICPIDGICTLEWNVPSTTSQPGL